MTLRTGAMRTMIALGLLAVAVVILAPATLVDALLATRTHGAWRIADASGRWWRGAGTLVARSGSPRLPITWRVSFPLLLRGMLDVALFTPGGHALATIEVARSRLALRNLDLNVPASTGAAVAAEFAPAAIGITAGGALALRAPQFEWHGGRVTGSLDARWDRARLAFAAMVVDLGEVTLAVSGHAAGEPLHGTLANRGGDLALFGDFIVDRQSVSARLALAPRLTAPKAVRALLEAAGHPDASGQIHLAWRSAW